MGVLFEHKHATTEDYSSSDEDESTAAFARKRSSSSRRAGKVKKVKFEVFVEAVLRLRGQNSATVKDLTDLREFVQHRFDDLEKDFVEKLQITDRAGRRHWNSIGGF